MINNLIFEQTIREYLFPLKIFVQNLNKFKKIKPAFWFGGLLLMLPLAQECIGTYHLELHDI